MSRLNIKSTIAAALFVIYGIGAELAPLINTYAEFSKYGVRIPFNAAFFMTVASIIGLFVTAAGLAAQKRMVIASGITIVMITQIYSFIVSFDTLSASFKALKYGFTFTILRGILLYILIPVLFLLLLIISFLHVLERQAKPLMIAVIIISAVIAVTEVFELIDLIKLANSLGMDLGFKWVEAFVYPICLLSGSVLSSIYMTYPNDWVSV